MASLNYSSKVWDSREGQSSHIPSHEPQNGFEPLASHMDGYEGRHINSAQSYIPVRTQVHGKRYTCLRSPSQEEVTSEMTGSQFLMYCALHGRSRNELVRRVVQKTTSEAQLDTPLPCTELQNALFIDAFALAAR